MLLIILGFLLGHLVVRRVTKLVVKLESGFLVVLVTTYGCAGIESIDYYGGSILYAISGGVR